jgi:hypothetical protein
MTTLMEMALAMSTLSPEQDIKMVPVHKPEGSDHVEYFAQQVDLDHVIYYNPEDWSFPCYKGGVHGR